MWKLISAVFCGIAAWGVALLFVSLAAASFRWLLFGLCDLKNIQSHYYTPLIGALVATAAAPLFVIPMAFGAWCGEYFCRANLTPVLKALRVLLVLGLATYLVWFALHVMAIHAR